MRARKSPELLQVALNAAVLPEGVMHPPLPLDQMDHPKLPTVPVLFEEQVWVPAVRAGPVGHASAAKAAVAKDAATRVAAIRMPIPAAPAPRWGVFPGWLAIYPH